MCCDHGLDRADVLNVLEDNMTANELSEIPDVPEVSAYTGIPEPTLRWYRSRGMGPRSFRVGRKIRYRKADVLAWLDEQERKSARGGVR